MNPAFLPAFERRPARNHLLAVVFAWGHEAEKSHDLVWC